MRPVDSNAHRKPRWREKRQRPKTIRMPRFADSHESRTPYRAARRKPSTSRLRPALGWRFPDQRDHTSPQPRTARALDCDRAGQISARSYCSSGTRPPAPRRMSPYAPTGPRVDIGTFEGTNLPEPHFSAKFDSQHNRRVHVFMMHGSKMAAVLSVSVSARMVVPEWAISPAPAPQGADFHVEDLPDAKPD